MLISSAALSSQHGDLTALNQAVVDGTSTLHTIQLTRTPHGNNESELIEGLDLSVGRSGVIGRISSVQDGEGKIGNGIRTEIFET